MFPFDLQEEHYEVIRIFIIGIPIMILKVCIPEYFRINPVFSNLESKRRIISCEDKHNKELAECF